VSEPSIVTALDLVFYWVSDLGRAVGFYRDVLGLDLVQRDGDSWVEFDVGGRRLALHAVAEGQPVQAGGATAVFSVNDLDEAAALLEDRGVTAVHEGDVEGFARFASFLDPDGNTFQLIEYARAQVESGADIGGPP
jgi:predicted enzyme related to lactoylglutathione lyase